MNSAKSINAVFNVLSDKVITLDELAKISPCSRHETVKIMSRLVSKGVVIRLETGVYKLSEYGKSLKSNGLKEIFHSGPQGQYNRNKHSNNTLRSRIWRLIILNKKVSVDEMLPIATDGDEKSPESNIRKYIKALVKSGYLLEMPRRIKGDALTSNGFKQYMLLRETGPKAPIFRNDKKEMFDPNTGEVFKWQA